MHLLILPEYAVERPHVVVDHVYTGHLPRSGHTVDVIRPSRDVDDITVSAAPWPDGRIVTFPDEPLGAAWTNIGRALRRRRWLRRALDRTPLSEVDAVIVRNDLLAASHALALQDRYGTRVIFQISSPDAEFRANARGGGLGGAYSRLRGRMDRRRRARFASRASAVLAISADMRRYLVETDGLCADKVFAFPMGAAMGAEILPEDVAHIRRDHGLHEGRTLMYSGVLDPVRSPSIMLDVLDRVRRQIPDTRLLVVTYQQDERRAAFERQVERRGLPVTVAGPVHHSRMPTYMAACDVMVSPYPPRIEHAMCSPTKSIEAAAAGLPVVGNEEVKEHVRLLREGGAGIAVPYDADAFADACVRLLRDPAERKRIGDAGIAWTRIHRSYERLALYLDTVVRAVVDGQPLHALEHDPDLWACTS